ncbi:MAG TPA: crotonase/enoyl-CoA hydratase family protein [Acetobacteraceae bacterium]|nr:crotonase/enoyl-CoA hydratase family protein [Acetobacteraceae bacterium]
MTYLGNAITTLDALASTTALSREGHYGTQRGFDAPYETISLVHEAPAGILWCYMDQPGKPIVTHRLLDELIEMQAAVREAVDDETVAKQLQYFVFASRAPGIYSLGGDLAYFVDSVRRRDRASVHSYARKCVDIVHSNVNALHAPLITFSLVQGDALGGGFETALSFDVIVAERSAKMGLPEILFNLFPGMGAYSLLSRRIDSIRAEQMIMSGRIYTAEELHEIGLVDVLAEDGEGEDTLRAYIDRNRRKFNAHRAIYQARRIARPVPKQELVDIVDVWVDAVFQLTDHDMRRMTHLTAAQDRRLLAEAASG